ncbi:MAG: class I SAM-dependent methyltransferase [Myxococcaceae bacterium]|jgi:2-polyprenyl-3-methyl-5-hydroxy-6-metoxy-1,4-benzoquinol methylase|nr:class I SAM-dependent methyltransferase [Myxococcaceae bacterium]MCA3012993.1 class I SAM-dependent methyltransferase [Myxococcaceae bacterium]
MRGFHPALAVFAPLPLAERLFVRARLFSAPLEAMADRAVGTRLLDVGCGHGVLTALLAVGFPERQVVGIDPDARKIDWARRSVGTFQNVQLEATGVDALAARAPGQFDTVFVADVLYLLPPPRWPAFLSACRALLVESGRLVLKEAEDDGSWRAKKTLWQERVMVKVLGRTQQSGAVGFEPRQTLSRALEEAGFSIRESASMTRGYTTPHVIFVAECA